MWPFQKKYVRVRQYLLRSPYPWLETIFLISDRELDHLSGWTLGFYHCTACGAYQGFAHRVPDLLPADQPGNKAYQPTDPIAHNERNAFWRLHAHGDGRVILFERDMEVPENAPQRLS